ncbi:MAG: TonB family protein [Acidobacteriota bacterium]|nr:TonB family protein [Acidobacteriota bacterium]
MTERSAMDRAETAATSPAWDHWEGKYINGEFALRQYLGGSDHSAVYLTEIGGQTPQRASIKLLRAGGDAENQLSRWKSAMGLSHPGLLRIYKFGRTRVHNVDILFVVMEYADEDLSQILPQRVLTSAEVRDMLAPTLGVLSFLHAKGLAVGRLKPSNILADREQLKLASDNVHMDGDPSNVAIEKPSPYDAPEHSSGGSSIAGDIWALGVTLCEALTGKTPVMSAGSVNATLPKTLPAEFAPIVSHCLERDPERRWTAAEIGAGLRRSPGSYQKVESERIAGNGSSHTALTQLAGGGKKSVVLPAIVLALIAAPLIGYLLLHHREGGNSEQTAVTQPVNSGGTPSSESEHAQQQPPVIPSERSREAVAAKPRPSAPFASAPVVAPSKATTRETAATSDEILHQVLPVVPQSARNTIEGKIRVNVRVSTDSAGNVSGTHLDRSGPSKYFARLASEAAQQWKFKPQSVARDWVLHFRFSRGGVVVDPTPADR